MTRRMRSISSMRDLAENWSFEAILGTVFMWVSINTLGLLLSITHSVTGIWIFSILLGLVIVPFLALFLRNLYRSAREFFTVEA